MIIFLCRQKGGAGLGNFGRAASLTETCATVLETLQKFVAEDPVHSGIPFTNVMDKGNRVVLAAWRAGQQLTLQPDFARSDRYFKNQEKFSGLQALQQVGPEMSAM